MSKCLEIDGMPIQFLAMHEELMRAIAENMKSKKELIDAITGADKKIERLKSTANRRT